MFQTLKNAWKIVDLRKKLLFTLLIIIIFRIGSAIPVPFLDMSALKELFSGINQNGNLLGYINTLTGDAFSKATVFALSITPYINASIIMQLLTVAIPPLERLAKDGGDEGRKKLNKITRYVTVGLGFLMSTAYYLTLRNQGVVNYTDGFYGWLVAFVIIFAFSAGSALIVWLGELINDKGIGNGISIILFAGIISRIPAGASYLWAQFNLDDFRYKIYVPIIVVLAVVVVAFIVVMTNAERRIPVQYAKRVVGRKQYGGQNTHIPIKVNMSGVMPIIFASSLIAIPGTIIQFFNIKNEFWLKVLGIFNYNSWFYGIVYFLLIIGFNYFYVAIQYNPIEIANNLRKNNGGIPGYRPGKPTSDFISKVLSRIVLIGALFLGIVAVFPIILQYASGMQIALGGTSVLIIVGVALETVRTLESQMMMRHYKGFLE